MESLRQLTRSSFITVIKYVNTNNIPQDILSDLNWLRDQWYNEKYERKYECDYSSFNEAHETINNYYMTLSCWRIYLTHFNNFVDALEKGLSNTLAFTPTSYKHVKNDDGTQDLEMYDGLVKRAIIRVEKK
jgi:hypothetical protein